MGSIPALPVPVIIEIGYMVTDWAVIEQLITLHVVQMSGQDPSNIPTGFSKLRKHWQKLAREQSPDLAAEIEQLGQRLHKRSTARNYVVHGYWRQVGPDAFTSTWINYRGGSVRYDTLKSTFEQLKEQSKWAHELRNDVAKFTNRLLKDEPLPGR